MGCFEKLVTSKFLANISSELSLARKKIQVVDPTQFPSTINFNATEKKRVYKDYLYFYFLMEEMSDSVIEAANDKLDPDTLFCVEADHIVFIYSSSLNQIKEAIKYSYNTSGLFPIYRSKHKIRNKVMYTALMDTRILFSPISPN